MTSNVLVSLSMAMTRYLQWAKNNHANGWADLLERVQGFLPRFRRDATSYRAFDDSTIYKTVVALGASAIADFPAPVGPAMMCNIERGIARGLRCARSADRARPR